MKPEPVFFTFYFDKDFTPNELYFDQKIEQAVEVLRHKCTVNDWDPEDYDPPRPLMVNGQILIRTNVVVGDGMWTEEVNVMRIGMYPKGHIKNPSARPILSPENNPVKEVADETHKPTEH